MRYALLNPKWSFQGSTYFGCPEPHFPLELLSAREMLRAAGHEVLLIDAFMEDLTPEQVETRLNGFGEDFLVIPTAPSYLFWRCPQPELRVPKQWIAALGPRSTVVVIGPHGSVTPNATLDKTGADIVLRGEPDQTLPQLASMPWEMIAGCCWRERATGAYKSAPGLGVVDMQAVPMLDYSDYPVERHRHLHHIFPGNGADHLMRGAEVEFARGCPYSCTFCNKTLFRNKYRERRLEAVVAEIDQLIARGVDYIYFIDEIFGVGKTVRGLLEEIAKRPVSIGFQTRIDLWDEQSPGPAGACALRLLRMRHRIDYRRRPRRDEQKLPDHDRTHHGAAGVRAAANSLGTGQPDQDPRGRPQTDCCMASGAEVARRMGFRAGADVPVPRQSGIRNYFWRAARRAGLGTRPQALFGSVRRQRLE